MTGGIASGKSTVVRMLQDECGQGMTVFDCDRAVAALYEDKAVVQEIKDAFGDGAVESEGGIKRKFLRNLLIANPKKKKKLEQIIHPKVSQMCTDALNEAQQCGCVHTFIADVPLYFESMFSEWLRADVVCTVAVSRERQLERLKRRNELTPEESQALIDAQAPTEEKMDKANCVIWNECHRDILRKQVHLFYRHYLEKDISVFNASRAQFSINDFQNLTFTELQAKVKELCVRRFPGDLTRRQLISGLVRALSVSGSRVFATGIISRGRLARQYALRYAEHSFRPGADDVLISQELMDRYALRLGNKVKVQVRGQQRWEHPILATDVLEIEGTPTAEYVQPTDFERLTPIIPQDRLLLENKSIDSPAMRLLDLVAPLGKGQRALVVAPPRGGKTILLKTIAQSIRANYPEAELLVLLLDERPEEVTDFEETVDVPVFASTFDECSLRHEQLSDIVLERARRLVEQKKDVVILLDSLTRLARGYNANIAGGRTMSGGLDSHALEKPRKFFGAARNIEEGGSFTIIATCLVDTESRMDQIIFEEFKGTGNMEVRLDRELAERRVYPAISLPQSGTRNDDRLYHPDEFSRILQLRRQLATLPGWEALEVLLANIKKTQNNAELLLRGLSR